MRNMTAPFGNDARPEGVMMPSGIVIVKRGLAAESRSSPENSRTMKEKSHRAKRRCYRSGVWTLRGTHTRRLDGHSLYNAQRAQAPRDFQADYRSVRSAPSQLRWRRDSDQGGRRPTRADVALGQRHSRSPAARQDPAPPPGSPAAAHLPAGLWVPP